MIDNGELGLGFRKDEEGNKENQNEIEDEGEGGVEGYIYIG